MTLRSIIQDTMGERGRAYLKAHRQCPLLVDKESPKGSPAQVCDYWTTRLALFSKRALLPLDQTGEGALGRRDLILLNSAAVLWMPHPERSVLCLDPRKRPQTVTDCWERVCFYYWSMCCDDKPLTLLFAVDEGSAKTKNSAIAKVIRAVPVQLNKIYAWGSGSSVARAVSHLLGSDEYEAITCIAPKQEIYAKLAPSFPNLPRSLGGEWGHEKFVQWQELRCRHEWGLPPVAGKCNQGLAKLFDFSNVLRLHQLSPTDQVERKRRLNLLHSRRKRERERIEVQVLQDECASYDDKNKQLQTENARLEGLLTLAHKKCAAMQTTSRLVEQLRDYQQSLRSMEAKEPPQKKHKTNIHQQALILLHLAQQQRVLQQGMQQGMA